MMLILHMMINRWYHAINYGVYGNESSKQPYLVGDVYYFNSTRIRLTYNENIAVKYYNGTTASIPKGFKITNGSRTLDDDNIISSEIVGSSLYLDFNQEIQLGENLTYGSGLDSYGKPVIISNVTSLPVKPIFNYVLIATKPEYSLNSTNYTDSASIVEHRLFWESESVGLSGHIFSINNGTGIFVNDSWVSMTGSANWSNVTKYINGTAGNNIQFKYFVNDTENGWTESDTYNYITTGALDTCTYSGSGDWEVDCNDNCTITTNTDTTTNALIINGAVGYFELLANVTCEMFAIEEGCQFRNKMNDNKRLAVKED